MENIKIEVPMEIASKLVERFGLDSNFFPACKITVEQRLDKVYLNKSLVALDAHITHVYIEIETKSIGMR
jgi:hypothetical protein